jgi:L-ribulose-5-phosphate 4-epimerase
VERSVPPTGQPNLEHSSLDRLRDRVVAANRAIVAAHLVTLTFGNVSARDRETGLMAIKPSGIPYRDLRPQMIPVLEVATGAVVAGEMRPSSDTPTHLVLYRAFPDIGGVVHTHSVFATAWAQARRELPCLGTTHADHFHGAVPVTRSLSRDEVQSGYEEHTGDVIVERLMEVKAEPLQLPAMLVASHGPFTWGTDAEEAVENAVALEMVAECACRSLLLVPDAQPIPQHLLEKHFERKRGPAAYYGQSGVG